MASWCSCSICEMRLCGSLISPMMRAADAGFHTGREQPCFEAVNAKGTFIGGLRFMVDESRIIRGAGLHAMRRSPRSVCCRPPQCRLRVGKWLVPGKRAHKGLSQWLHSRGSRTLVTLCWPSICTLILVDEVRNSPCGVWFSMAQLTVQARQPIQRRRSTSMAEAMLL